MDSILASVIERKMLSQTNVESYIITPIVLTIDRASFYLNLGNDFYFHITTDLSLLPDFSSLKMSCSDNFVVQTKANYGKYSMYKNTCFRDYLEIDTAIIEFVPYQLEFLKVTPNLKRK